MMKNEVKEPETNDAVSGQVDPLVMRDEAGQLAAYHKTEGDYSQDCYSTQKRIASDKPMHTSPEHQTKEDWLNSAAEWAERRDYHRARARYWNKFLNA